MRARKIFFDAPASIALGNRLYPYHDAVNHVRGKLAEALGHGTLRNFFLLSCISGKNHLFERREASPVRAKRVMIFFAI